MLNPSWTRCRPSRSLGTMSTTTSHTPDTATPNSNDVARFVYTWFTLCAHRARPESLTAYLADSEQLSLRFPGSEMHTIQQFTDWYQALLANTTWNFHELSGLTIQPAVSGFTVGFGVDWQGGVSRALGWRQGL